MADNQLWQFFRRHLGTLILIGVILIAVWFRFYQLDKLPPGLHPDEAANGQDIFRMIDHHDFRIFYNTNGPREALFFYFQAIFVLLLGNTILALRLAPAIFGTLAVIAAYFLATDWFGRRVGFISAFFFAINPWATTVTRDGFRATMVPVVIVVVAYLAGRAFKTGRTKYFVLSGIVFGLGFYTYPAYSLMVLAALACGVYLFFARRHWLSRNKRALMLGFVSLVITLLPYLTYTALHPRDTSARAAGTSFLNKNLNGGRPLATLIDGVTKTALMFNFRGDENYRHNLGGEPMLDIFVGLMFVLGLLVALYNIERPKYFALLAIFGTMLLPAALTAEGLPHGLRAIGVLATVFILAGIGLNYLLSRWYVIFPINSLARNIGLGLILVLLILTAIKGYKQYFVAWAQDPKTYQAYSEDMVAIGNYLNSHDKKNEKAYLLVDGYSIKTVDYLTHKKTPWQRLELTDLKNLPLSKDHQLFIIQDSANNELEKEIIETLKAKYPNGHLREEFSSFNNQRLFYTFEVNS